MAGADRTVRVRSRLILAVAVVGITVLAAGAPSIVTASAELNESQRLVTLAQQSRQTVTLAHSLADERDEVAVFIAAGRGSRAEGTEGAESDAKRPKVSEERTARVDRQIAEITPDAPGDLRRDLERIDTVRAAALTGKGSASDAHQAYSEVIGELLALAGQLAEQTPPRATGALGATRALVPLGQAVEQASASRGLALGALAVPRAEDPVPQYNPATGLWETAEKSSAEDGERDALSAAAQQSRVREQAALADFRRTARPDARDSLASTVTGPEVKTAEGYLDRLTDQPTLSKADRRLDRERVDSALSARIDRMRSVESALASDRADALAQLRDDDVTSLEVRIGFLGVCLLIALGVSMAVARTLTRPLAVLRLGAARLASSASATAASSASPVTEGPIRFTGRNDEFAEVVRSLNALHEHTAQLHERATRLDADRTKLIGRNEKLATERTALTEQLAELRTGLEQQRRTLTTTSVSLSLRTLGLVERQLTVIEQLEAREQDPDQLATLFKIDHFATVMRRHSENLLVLAGAEHGQGHPGPVPLVDVMRAAVSEIERYERIDIQSLPPHARIAGHAADDISHLVAELLENATMFSPPDARVQLSGWLLESGEVMLSVQDEGIGVTVGRIEELNERLADPQAYETESGAESIMGLGLYVVARLAARHGVRAELRAQKQGGGTAAVVVVPTSLLPATPPAEPEHTPAVPGAPALHLPGSVAEANSNALPGRSALLSGQDPLVALAERTVREADAEPAHERAPETTAEPEPKPPAAEPEPVPTDAPQADAHDDDQPPTRERITDKGLPKRTPKVVSPGAAPAPERSGKVDADELRRRLGGFHQGAKDGRRDVETEIAERTEDETEDEGNTVEEART
ncbi:nitrate- and nitrite sensing domain-containing protein [Streptomyces sp. A3M-1-3]|nr:nitrate- and nitrite sensing domain-containing protein [Streptomyces sp. A3M-1-3]MCP3821732.1 nitrate- and nitrite sensing domain-containing protein [Streptomyces sp. A3M-1-3]